MLEPSLDRLLACPRHQADITLTENEVACPFGCRFPVVDGVPVMLLEEKEQSIEIAAASLSAARTGNGAPLYLDTIGLAEHEKRGIEQDYDPDGCIDSAISYLIGATCGCAYAGLIGRLKAYPIPSIPLPEANAGLLLDVGCNWGRWSVAASRKGWHAIGLDPSLGAIMAARRVFSCRERVQFVCGDARYLPFKADMFDAAFSYSVLQHFSHRDAGLAAVEIGRVLKPGALSVIQMAHAGGLRSMQVRRRKDYLAGGIFRVRYWSLNDLKRTFERAIGETRLRSEAFGGLGLLWGDRAFVPWKAKMLLFGSESLRRASKRVPALIRVADSVYVTSIRR